MMDSQEKKKKFLNNSQLKFQRILDFKFGPSVWGLVVLFILGIIYLLIALNSFSESIVKKMAQENIQILSLSVDSLRKIYTKEVVAKAHLKNLEVSNRFEQNPNAIPLPFSLTKKMNEEIGRSQIGIEVRLYSPYPFYANEKKLSEKSFYQDSFSKDAWNFLSLPENKNKDYFRLDRVDGKKILRLARADVLEESCVSCHNTHPDSPKRDWKVGDVRGILEIKSMIDGPMAHATQEVETILWILGGVAFLGLLGILGFAFMIRRSETERKQLLEQKDFIDQNAIISETDLEGKITYANKLFCDFSEYANEELVGQPHSVVNSGVHSKEFWQELWATIKSGKKWRGVICNKTKSGKRYWVDSVITPMTDSDGEMVGFRSMRIDVTEKVQAEEKRKLLDRQLGQNAKLASLGEMSAGIAHEINNPLLIISGNLPLLKKFKDEPEKFELKMRAMIKSIHRIKKIISGLTKFSRSSEVREQHLASLEDILQEVNVLTASKTKKLDAPLEINMSADIKIMCDEIEVEQVFIVLVNNAVDAVMDLKEKWVKINAFIKDHDVVIQVIDSGPGLNEELAEKIFEPFYTTKEIGKGTGLGLSIAKGILGQHNAVIFINQEIKNTCFEIHFPLPKT